MNFKESCIHESLRSENETDIIKLIPEGTEDPVLWALNSTTIDYLTKKGLESNIPDSSLQTSVY